MKRLSQPRLTKGCVTVLFVKITIALLLVFMVFSLFKAMVIMLKGDTEQDMSKYIGRRVIASAAIIGLIMLALAFGLITPNPKPY